MVECKLCGLEFKKITNSHLNKKHGISSSEFSTLYPDAERGLIPWNKGKTKYTHPSLMKLSKRLTKQKRWNFSKWQEENRIRLESLEKNCDLAELIGIILGDGNLSKYSRTEGLRVVCHSEKKKYMKHIAGLVEKVFKQRPKILKRKKEQATDIVFYKCGLSEALKLPCGNKINNGVSIPFWIKRDENYSISCLKGLFETDGTFCEDKENYTCVIEFKNSCKNLLQDVYEILKKMNYNPQLSRKYVRLARKKEVKEFRRIIDFRNY